MNLGMFYRPLLLGAVLIASSVTAQANDVVVDRSGVVPYVIDARNVVARSGTGLCWRTGFWSPAAAASAMAGEFPAGCACDPDIVPRENCVAPAAPAPAPAAAPAPAPAPTTVVLSAQALFGFDRAVLTPEGKAAIDTEVIAKLPQVGALEMVTIEGHTDRIGSHQYNQALSERRAMAVKAYLVERGISADLIDTIGYGKTSPVPGVSCPDTLGRSQLIACLEPHRRVQVTIRAKAN